MPRPVAHITTPWPSFEEMTRDLDIPVERQKELDELAEQIFQQITKGQQAAHAQATGRKEKPRNASAAA